MSLTPSQNLTPLLRQYLDIKKDYQDSILFFRMGDFYEMFYDDAKKASQVLEIALTSRNKNDQDSVPLCGVPHHASSSYIARLIQAGFKVAVCEQMEDPQTAKGIVKREVVRVITPGLILETESLDARVNNYLVSLAIHQKQYGLSLVDISTGEMRVAFFYELESLFSELARREPREILCALNDDTHPVVNRLRRQFPTALIQFHDPGAKTSDVLSFFSEPFRRSWENSALSTTSPLVERSALRLLDYVRGTLKKELHHLNEIHWMSEGAHLVLDTTTIRNLELVRNLQDGGTWATLLQVLDQTKTTMGSRRLKQMILYPLAHLAEIQVRQEAIAECLDHVSVLSALREVLSSVSDLERQNARIGTGIANARDLLSLGVSLSRLPQLRTEVQKLATPFFGRLLKGWNDLQPTASKIIQTLRDDAPMTLKEGGLIREKILPELDELRAISQDGKTILAKMEETERQRTGISSLKVRYNRVFGYYLEIPNSRKDAVPEDYIRKQTLVNAERYITPELKRYEEKVLGAEERIRQLEYEYFCSLRSEVGEGAAEIAQMASKIADLDALCSLAVVAQENRYCRPEFTEGSDLLIEEGRHPVLEKLFPAARFVPNDLSLRSEDCRLILLTGPNMAGKSTILRQTALIALMAHLGSFVPAKSVRLGCIDRIFTRIGASDQLSKNQSTFWVEMEETANILKSATAKSLIVLDEIGRGTSTYDGLSVAWAVAEYLHDEVLAKGLFATHYHELTALSQEKAAIQNFHIAVKEWNGEIVFLYRMLPGGTSQSYGIQVAALAGIPKKVTQRAEAILHDLQGKKKTAQMDLFEFNVGAAPSLSAGSLEDGRPSLAQSEGRHGGLPLQNPILHEISQISLEHFTPLQALQYLYVLQEKVGSSQNPTGSSG